LNDEFILRFSRIDVLFPDPASQILNIGREFMPFIQQAQR